MIRSGIEQGLGNMGVIQQLGLPVDFFDITIVGVIELLLTIALVGLYWRMHRTQKRQADIQTTQNEIMNKQANIMAAQHQPDIEHDGGWKIDDDSIAIDDDSIAIPLSNRGNGPGKNLHIQCVIYRQNEQEGESVFTRADRGMGTVVGPVTTPLRRMDEQAVGYGSEEEWDDNAPESAIEEGETDVWFEGEIKLSPQTVGSPSYEAPFSEVIKRLSREWESDKFAFEIFLLYSDLVNQLYRLRLLGYKSVPLNENLDLQRAREFGEETGPIGDVVPDGTQSPMMELSAEDLSFGS